MTMLHEVAAHLRTTPLAALAPFLWGARLLALLRQVMRQADARRKTPQIVDDREDLRPAA